MVPTVRALAADFRVATYSLCGEPGCPPLPESLDGYLAQVDEARRALGVERAVVAGISFGGWVAVRYAAAAPDRVAALVLASAPGPGFALPERYARWIAAPRRSFPVFVATAPGRVLPEVRRALPSWRARLAFVARQSWYVLRAPMSGPRAAHRVRAALGEDIGPSAGRVRAPTLLVTGEDGLDHLVPPASTRRYVEVIAGARVATLAGTGHMGTVTRAPEFAALVREFTRTIDDQQQHTPRHAAPGDRRPGREARSAAR
jgi:pimeloyl-ACP methyl ester carboxylesterase